MAVDLSWSNGLNHGSNFRVSFLDASNQTIYREQFSGFQSGSRTFPFAVPYPKPWRGSRSDLFNPSALKIETIQVFGDPANIAYTITVLPRAGYNLGGDSFSNAPLVENFPGTYFGSMYDGRKPPTGGTSVDPGQYWKVRLKCRQAMFVHGFATGSTQYGANFRVDVYNANQQLVKSSWVFTSSYGTTAFSSTPFVNPNSVDSDFYIRAWSYNWPVYDFTLNIDEYSPSNNPKPVAPDATGTGPMPNSEEYRLPSSVDPDVLIGRDTELWAKVYWPADFSEGPYPLVLFLHGNHDTCGRIGTSPRVDDNSNYTLTGVCPPEYVVVNNHIGYEYLADQLASHGYVVVSINANRGITGTPIT